MAKVSMRDMARTLKDLNKEPGNIPSGVWELRGVSFREKDVTKKNRDGEEYETVEYTLCVEPVRATASVNPDELAEVDDRTGKPVYEGKRIFCRFLESFRGDVQLMFKALTSMGIDEDSDVGDIIEKNLVRGKVAMGEVFNRTYPKNDGTQGTEQKVRNWAPKGTGAAASGLSI